MDTYKDQAESLYNRVEKQKGPNPTQQDIKDYLGKNYVPSQDNFIALAASFRQVGEHRQTFIPWDKDETDRLEELYEKFGKKTTTEQVDIFMREFGGRHTRQAVVKKRQRLIKVVNMKDKLDYENSV